MHRQSLNTFNPNYLFCRGRHSVFLAVWYLTKCLFFLSPLPWPSYFKTVLLRIFGASVGRGVVIKPRVNIHFPWHLTVGSHVWIGEQVEIYNFVLVNIGSHVCLSQQVFLCSGNHDFRDPKFSYRNSPISIGDGVWLQARVFVCPGTIIGPESIVTASSLAKGTLPANTVCSGSPALPVSLRWPLDHINT